MVRFKIQSIELNLLINLLFITGALYDLMGSYVPGFVVAGTAIALSGIILFALPACQRYVAKKQAAKDKQLNMVPL